MTININEPDAGPLVSIHAALNDAQLPGRASIVVEPGRIVVSNGRTFGHWRVSVRDDDGTLVVLAGHGNEVATSRATFAHVPTAIIGDAIVALCWATAGMVGAR